MPVYFKLLPENRLQENNYTNKILQRVNLFLMFFFGLWNTIQVTVFVFFSKYWNGKMAFIFFFFCRSFPHSISCFWFIIRRSVKVWLIRCAGLTLKILYHSRLDNLESTSSISLNSSLSYVKFMCIFCLKFQFSTNILFQN